MNKIIVGLRRAEEEFRLPKFSRGSEMTSHNLEAYRDVMVGPEGRGERLVSKLAAVNAVGQFVDFTGSDVDCGQIARVVFGGKFTREQNPDLEFPVVVGPKSHRFETLTVVTDLELSSIQAIRTEGDFIDGKGSVAKIWEEVRFAPDGEIFTCTSASQEPSLAPTVLDRVARSVTIAERKPFV